MRAWFVRALFSLLFPFARLWLDIFTLTMCRILASQQLEFCIRSSVGRLVFANRISNASAAKQHTILLTTEWLYKTGFRAANIMVSRFRVELRNVWWTRREKWTKWKTIDRFEMTKMLNYYWRWRTPRRHTAGEWNIIHARRQVFARSDFAHYSLTLFCTQHLRWTRRNGDATSCSYQEPFKHSKYLRLHVGRRWSATSTECRERERERAEKNGLHNSQRSSGQWLCMWFGNAVAQHQEDHLHCIPFA